MLVLTLVVFSSYEKGFSAMPLNLGVATFALVNAVDEKQENGELVHNT